MTVCVARYQNQRTYGEKFGESSDFLNFAICVYPRDKITDMRKNQDHMKFVGRTGAVVSVAGYGPRGTWFET